jgi:hypothetical protein
MKQMNEKVPPRSAGNRTSGRTLAALLAFVCTAFAVAMIPAPTTPTLTADLGESISFSGVSGDIFELV